MMLLMFPSWKKGSRGGGDQNGNKVTKKAKRDRYEIHFYLPVWYF